MSATETCPYCMQRADRCACEDPRIVGYENATPTPPAPADDAGGAEAMMPKDVPGAAEFRDAFKAAVPPQGADHASWVNGYCAGWIACEKAFPLPARDDAVEEAMAPGCHEHVALWDAINAYSAACGGHPTRGGGARMDAVVRVEKALRAALRGTRPEGHGGGK